MSSTASTLAGSATATTSVVLSTKPTGTAWSRFAAAGVSRLTAAVSTWYCARSTWSIPKRCATAWASWSGVMVPSAASTLAVGRDSGESRHRLLQEVYDAANRGDFDALLDRLHPDIVWVTPTRRITGRNQVAGWLIGWHASASPTHRPERFIDVEDTTIALVS